MTDKQIKNVCSRSTEQAEPNTIWLAEQSPTLKGVYATHLRAGGHYVVEIDEPETLCDQLCEEQPDLLILDMGLPEALACKVLSHVQALDMDIPILALANERTAHLAARSLERGADDYLMKPFDETRLLASIRRILETVQMREQLRALLNVGGREGLGDMVGSTPAMRAIYRGIDALSETTAPVLLSGAPGTGKRLAARTIHQTGPRRSGPFIMVDCTSLTSTQLDHEIFGDARAGLMMEPSARSASGLRANLSATGALRRAHGGSLYLRGVDALDIALQTKLLRFLQTGTVSAGRADRLQSLDVRLMCSMDADPLASISSGRFREDLFYRLNIANLSLPALAERKTDIARLARHFLAREASETHSGFRDLSDDAVAALEAWEWNENVRELEALVSWICQSHRGVTVEAYMLPSDGDRRYRRVAARRMESEPSSAYGKEEEVPGLVLGELAEASLADIERMIIENRIAAYGNSIPKAAHSLGISPSTIYRKKEGWDDGAVVADQAGPVGSRHFDLPKTADGAVLVG